MKKLFLLCTLFAVALSAQEPKRFVYVQRVFDIKYVDAKELATIVALGDVSKVVPNEHFKTISVYGTTENVAAAEELIKRFDTPRPSARVSSRNVELICYILLAAPKGTAGEAVPADLEPAVKQLKATFGYNDFRLLDSLLIRAQEGSLVLTDGNTAAPNAELPAAQGSYELKINRGIRVIPDEKSTRIRLDAFTFRLKVAGAFVNFNTDVDVREGQKVVIGKAKGDASAGALILVLSARVVD